MPELPEVETVRRRLLPHLSGRTLAEVEVLDHRLTDPEPPESVAARLQGVRIETLGRRGKYLIAELDDGAALLVHLRMTGNLLWLPAPPEDDPRFLRAWALLDDGSYLAYTDARRFGTWRIAEDGAEAWLAGKLGPEPLDGWVTADLARSFSGRKAPVKAAILDQRVVAGVGNIYADEALFAAKIHPAAPAGRLSRARIARLHAAVIAALEAGIEAQGASIRDFRTPDGGYGSAQERFAAYGRGGDPCVVCGTPLRRTVIAQRGTSYCPRCQRF
jgi:formamidopyrimidine-DNA glycosylase